MFNIQIISTLLSLISLVLCLGLIWKFWQFEQKRRIFKSIENPDSLEQILEDLTIRTETLENSSRHQEGLLNQKIHTYKQSVQKIGLCRFNAFQDEGGNLSFCLCILNEQNTGFILTNMHGRQSNRMYVKRINEGTSEIPLNEDEIRSYQIALSSWVTHHQPNVSPQQV